MGILSRTKKGSTAGFERNTRMQAPIGEYGWLPIMELPITEKQMEKGCLAKYVLQFPFAHNPNFISGVTAEVWKNDERVDVITASRVWKVEGQKRPGSSSLIWLDPSLKSYLIDLAERGVDVSSRELEDAPNIDISVSMNDQVNDALSKSGVVAEMVVKLTKEGESQEIVGVRNLYVQLDYRFIDGLINVPKLFVTLPRGNNMRNMGTEDVLPDGKVDCAIDINFLTQNIINPWKSDLDFDEIKEIIHDLRNEVLEDKEEEDLEIDAEEIKQDVKGALENL